MQRISPQAVKIFHPHYNPTLMITKRQLGIAFILLGAAAIAGLFAWDLIGAGKFQGVGPAQRLALAGCGLLILVGATLLPLGNRPA
jgi:hypothetical protein